MSFSSTSLIQRLQELERQIAETPQHVQSLLEAQGGGDLAAYLGAKLDADRHLREMAITTGQLKAQVVDADQLGAELTSLSELVLRAQRHLLLSELTTLREIVCSPAAGDRARALFRAPFESFDRLASVLGTELDRITRLWLPYRSSPGAERPDYRTAVRAAHTAMRQLGGASDVAHFLRDGRARTDWPAAVREGCARMLDALTISIDVHPELPLLEVDVHAIHAITAERTP